MLGDDAGWIDTLAGQQFPAGQRRLDGWHLARDLRQQMRGAGREWAAGAWGVIGTGLWEGRTQEVVCWLAAEAERWEEPIRRLCRSMAEYLQAHRTQLAFYEQCQKRGEWISS
ncbi:MAG: hypothetical protein HY320_15475, partial [Armatimonadetes bacterium]|nr:hypothetical protein [Armatimonadota bacterium]